ncbi:serine hydrolase [Sphaerobacter sp.]|uniref:serine hydrolase n=1 Tax=Sphaerobacter sp. TaxID=2099654 RepID=UPI0025CBFFD7|nr:serine hydrolase [Sphaerobacter sp.]
MSNELTRPGTLDEAVRDAMTRWSVPGIAVGILRDGAVETHGYGVASLETGFPVRPDTLFQIGSISKVYTATLAMQLVEEGKLSLDTPVIEYLPDLKLADADAQRTITMRHLLTHTSGLEGDRFDDYGNGDDALAKAIAEFHTLRQWTAPGELWTYCNSGFYLAGRVIEQILGQTFEQAMRERVFQPLGMEHSFFFAYEAIVYPVAVGHTQVAPGSAEHKVARLYPLPRVVNAAGGIIANVADLLRFAAFHMSDGTVGGKQVLTAESIAAMQEQQVKAGNFAEAYGIGWSLHTVDGVKVVSHGGSTNGFQAQLALVPSRRFAIAILTNADRGAAAHRDIQRWALEHELGLRHADPEPITLPAEVLERVTGTYKRPHSTITLSVDEGRLKAEIQMSSPLTGETETLPPLYMSPISEQEFIITEGEYRGMRTDVILGDNGKPRFLRFSGRLAEYVQD